MAVVLLLIVVIVRGYSFKCSSDVYCVHYSPREIGGRSFSSGI
ncbi:MULTISPECIES: hypothetical protein [Ehrlichia]|uniref:Uncharacterized protein n=1 Tax=Ehrlichia cf. muris str. EmCRT TaxID=1359167 RepID=A0A0F3ND23_9RICK|nr:MULTISPECIES: hypothetical protein [Ehrlichia]KJV65587.1 hypothetical protein EMUCRT_0532 [Ehrlichia cf. muris str. EmCRT]